MLGTHSSPPKLLLADFVVSRHNLLVVWIEGRKMWAKVSTKVNRRCKANLKMFKANIKKYTQDTEIKNIDKSAK